LVRSILLEIGWRRHSIISHGNGGLAKIAEALPEKIQELLKLDGAIAIVATYDCAVVDEDFDREPWIQLLVSFPENPSNEFILCRHPRRLHFLVEFESEQINYEINAIGICQIERERLCSIEPDNNFSLDAESSDQLKLWIAERFRQETWPDAFNAALMPAKNRLKSLYRRYNQYVPALYLQLTNYDELQDEKYEISVIFAVDEDNERALLKDMRAKFKQLADKKLEIIYDHIADDVLRAFGDSVIFREDPTTTSKKSIEIMSEGSITVLHLRKFVRFSPFNLSVSNNTTPLPVDLLPGKV